MPDNSLAHLRIAVVHEWLTTYSGSERVLEQMLRCYPHANLFSVVDFLPSDQRDFIQNKPVSTSFIQRLPFAHSKYRGYLPLMPLAVEQFNLSGYDIVISNSHAVAKGVLTGPDQLHVCYCHSPMRYAWDLQHQYLHESGWDMGLKGWLARWILHRMRLWDMRTANGVDFFMSNSAFIARRIKKVYRRESCVIYPPVDIETFIPSDRRREDFYLTASRLVPYKQVGLIVEAFAAMPDQRLVVVGTGPELSKIKAKSAANVELLGHQSTDVLRDYMQRARAFVFAAEEDFGIVPLEAQACGTPVIAFGKGGALETIRGRDTEHPTGIFFFEQSVPAIQAAVNQFEKESGRMIVSACRQNAERFSPERFRDEFSSFVEGCWAKFQADPLGWDRPPLEDRHPC